MLCCCCVPFSQESVHPQIRQFLITLTTDMKQQPAWQRYKNAGHGFGLGTGTDAAGWLYKAVAFWQSQMKQ